MPQRASHVRWNGESMWGSDALTRSPELGAMVAATINAWAATETHLGRLFGSLAGTRHPVAMEMYSIVRSFEVQRDLIKAAAVELLPKRYAIAVIAGLEVVKKSYGTRNQFAHWVWGTSTDPALEALLLVEPRKFWSFHIEEHRWWNDRRLKSAIEKVGPQRFWADKPEISRDDIWVYRRRDLEAKRAEIERAYRLVEALRALVVSETARRRTIYRWLCSEADILAEVIKATNNRSSGPRPRPARRGAIPRA